MLECLTELRKLVYPLAYWLITKDIKGYETTGRGRDTQGRVLNKGALVLVDLGAWRHVEVRGGVLVPQPGKSPHSVLLDFHRGFYYVGLRD